MTSFSITSEYMEPSNVSIIHVAGYLDAHTAPELEKEIRTSVRQGRHRIIVDFGSLEYISSAGLGVFMVFIEEVRANKGDIKLAAMPTKVYSVFDLLGFPVLFSIYEQVDDALAAFPAP
ncbi:MAG: STAS domain-containing protein [Bradyrhizobiaceae bacterium]|nr:STAS domain-containing protein [Bradyrhizobiaceae bacterium]